MFNLHEYLYLILSYLLGYNLIVFVPLIVLPVKIVSAPPHTFLSVITKPLPYTSGYIHYTPPVFISNGGDFRCDVRVPNK